LDIARLEAGYPREVEVERADKLWLEEMKHAVVIQLSVYSPTNYRDDSIVHGSSTSATISGDQQSTISSILNHAKGF
jgi:hypothetical protein